MTGNTLISRAALARLAKCTKANVTQRCRSELAPARVGPKVDLAHPCAQAFLARHRVGAADVAAAVERDGTLVPIFSADLLQLELRTVLALHDPRYRQGEPVRLARLIRAFRRMDAQLRLNEAARDAEQTQPPI